MVVIEPYNPKAVARAMSIPARTIYGIQASAFTLAANVASEHADTSFYDDKLAEFLELYATQLEQAASEFRALIPKTKQK